MNQDLVLTAYMDVNIVQITQHVNNALMVKVGFLLNLTVDFTAYNHVWMDKMVALDVMEKQMFVKLVCKIIFGMLMNKNV